MSAPDPRILELFAMGPARFSWPHQVAENRFTIRTRRTGANPEKSDLVNFRGPDWRKFSELCALLFFLGKTDKILPKSWFSEPILGHSAGPTKLDRPHCKIGLLTGVLGALCWLLLRKKLGFVSPHLPVGKKFLRFCPIWPA